jgi:hypothetical protein
MIHAKYLTAFRETLYAGNYNLLLGSGISLTSKNASNENLRSTEALRKDLCKLVGVGDNTSITRAYSLLSQEQINSELTDKFSECVPNSALQVLPFFLWYRLFTFNIDDVIENLYSTIKDPKQNIIAINFDDSFEPAPTKQELQSIHLHGWVKKPLSKYVFSHTEYSRMIRSLNPWMHLLSEILATESFIIAGASLNEIDLDYYLSFRSASTPRRSRGPSLFICPDPDKATESDCARFDLILVKSRFEDFLNWLKNTFPTPPNVVDLVVPDASSIFDYTRIDKKDLLRFFMDFELVSASSQPLGKTPSPFLYGREPTWTDLYQHFDIERTVNTEIARRIQEVLYSTTDSRIVIILDDAGTGKTTTIYRTAQTLSSLGIPVLNVKTLSRINIAVAHNCLANSLVDIVLIVDGFADHVEQIMEILDDTFIPHKIAVLCSERIYRQEYIKLILGPLPSSTITLPALSTSECSQLIERYNQFGLVADAEAIKSPIRFANRICADPVAIAVCRILHDFKPIENIVDSLWTAADDSDRLPYLCVALAQHCYSAGIRYSIIQRILGVSHSVSEFFKQTKPLRLCENSSESDFIITLNTIIGEQILARSAQKNSPTLLEAFKSLASELAPHVNRRTIMSRSPEARLSGRLFDSDKVVKPLLGDLADEFYNSVQEKWQWNSRYWEQRALQVASSNLVTALQYARHAIALEKHPFPYTTLGKVLLLTMEENQAERDTLFREAFTVLTEAIEMEARTSRITIHPFGVLLSGAAKFLDLGGELTDRQYEALMLYIADAETRFKYDPMVISYINSLQNILNPQ